MRVRLRTVLLAALLSGVAQVGSAQQPSSAPLGGLTHQVACAPSSPRVEPKKTMRVVGGTEMRRTLFAPGDKVMINAGTRQGVRAGETFFVRRLVRDRIQQADSGSAPFNVHTAGVIEVVEAAADVSVAAVTLGCDGVAEGDYLDRYSPVVVPTNAEAGAPDFANPARVVLGAERRILGAPGDFMVVDRGSQQGVRAGQALTVFRTPAGPAGPLTTVGTARVYAVTPETATIRIEQSVDAVYTGDLVAIHR
jgi:hypothetical protein